VYGEVFFPVLDIVDWVRPSQGTRLVLSATPPTWALASPASKSPQLVAPSSKAEPASSAPSLRLPDAPRTSLKQDVDDEIPFLPEWR
jgi:hypothetical protein